MNALLRLIAYTAATAFCIGQAVAASPAKYAATGRIPLSDGGWDYVSVDPDGGRVYVARSDAIDAIALDTKKATKLADASRAHAVLPIPGTPLLLETDGNTNAARLIDRHTGAETARIPVGERPDAAIYDPATRNAIVMNAKSGTVSVVDPAKAMVTATIQLSPGLEFAAIDNHHRLYVNNEDDSNLEVVDLGTMKVEPTIALGACEHPTGLAYSAKANRLISACANGIATIVDPDAQKAVGTLAIGDGPDAVIDDEARGLAFIPCGRSGELIVIGLDGAAGPVVLDRITTAKGARTGAVDPKTGKLYLPNADFAPSETPGGRPSLVPGSVNVMIVSPRSDQP